MRDSAGAQPASNGQPGLSNIGIGVKPCQNPNDSIIYGRASGFAYAIDRDDATPAGIARCNWKKKWPHNIPG
jgi:hypothetical protein